MEHKLMTNEEDAVDHSLLKNVGLPVSTGSQCYKFCFKISQLES